MELDFAYVGLAELCLRLLCAAGAGALLGLDRELRHRKVGIRTYMIVSLGSASFALVTMEMSLQVVELGLNADPTRLMQGLIGAIGFLGAGAIIQGDRRVGGMATAASLWVAGSVGMASGLGYFVHAVLAAAGTAAILAMSRLMSSRGSEDRPDLDG